MNEKTTKTIKIEVKVTGDPHTIDHDIRAFVKISNVEKTQINGSHFNDFRRVK